jgi:hypothetical protein
VKPLFQALREIERKGGNRRFTLCEFIVEESRRLHLMLRRTKPSALHGRHPGRDGTNTQRDISLDTHPGGFGAECQGGVAQRLARAHLKAHGAFFAPRDREGRGRSRDEFQIL